MFGDSSGNAFEFKLKAFTGQRFVIETSTNLVDWLPLPYYELLPGTNGQMSLQVPIGSEPRKFFRFSATY